MSCKHRFYGFEEEFAIDLKYALELISKDVANG